jgi:uncharacterized protein YukE
MPEQLIPGSPEKLRDLARRLDGGADTLRAVRRRLRNFHRDEDWRGEAASAFRNRAGGLPKQLGQAEARFRGTARALRPYAETLEEAQRIGRRGQDDFEEAWGDLHRARDVLQREPRATAHAAVNSAQEAVDDAAGQIAQAKKMVEEAADRCAAAIAEAIDDPLQDPDDWWTTLDRAATEFGQGFWENTTGVLGDVLGAVVEKPGDFANDVKDNVIDMVDVTDWDTFTSTWGGVGKDLVAWDDWTAGRPMRAMGKIAGSTVLGLGAGKLLKRVFTPRPDLPESRHGSEGLPDRRRRDDDEPHHSDETEDDDRDDGEPPPERPDPDDIRPKDLKNVDSKRVERMTGENAERIKEEHMGRGSNVGRFNLRRDRKSGFLVIVDHKQKVVEVTNIHMDSG